MSLVGSLFVMADYESHARRVMSEQGQRLEQHVISKRQTLESVLPPETLERYRSLSRDRASDFRCRWDACRAEAAETKYEMIAAKYENLLNEMAKTERKPSTNAHKSNGPRPSAAPMTIP